MILALGLVPACAGAPRAPAVPTAPLAASDLLPVDLDYVIRLDTERLRASEAFAGLADRISPPRGSGLFRLLRLRLERSRALLFGGRLLADGFHGDGVLVVEGSRADAAPDPAFRPIASPRPDVHLFERTSDVRGEPVLEARCDDGGLALATAAEADAVLRVVREGPDMGRLQPRAHGVLSFAGRPFATAAAKPSSEGVWPNLARGLRRYDGSLELIDGVEAEIDLEYASADDRAAAASVAQALVARMGLGEKPLRTLADSVRFSPRDSTLGVRFRVPLDVLAAVNWAGLASAASRDDIAAPAER